MTNHEILKIAMAQSANDLCADASDFEKEENIIVLSTSSTLINKLSAILKSS